MPQTILIVTSGIFHPSFLARRALIHALEKIDNLTYQRVSSLEALPHLDMGNFASIVLYVHHKNITAAALSVLDNFVTGGGGLLALHSATASFKQTLPYFKILGGRFIGHGDVEKMEIQPVNGENSPFQGIPAFQVRDELYLHELQPGIRVHFQALHQDKLVPVVWTYQHGEGKVCYACPGHTTASMQNVQVQEIVRRGLAWVSA